MRGNPPFFIILSLGFYMPSGSFEIIDNLYRIDIKIDRYYVKVFLGLER